MELWIRSQDKEDLVKAYNLRILNESNIAINVEVRNSSLDYLLVGKYATKERALEILDEIQDRFHQTFICDLDCLVSKRDYENIKSGLEHEYPSKEFMIQPQHYELKPINSDVVIYEMPKE